MNLEQKIADFKAQITSSGIIDPEGQHHVFSQGLHGRKIDFDLIPDASELYKQWVDITVNYIRANYAESPAVIVGVANGTNRLALSVADRLSNNTVGLTTFKPEGSRNQPILTNESRQKLQDLKPKFTLILEDVGTRGTNSASVARSIQEAGFKNLEVLNSWQRSESLPLIDELNVKYKAVIKDVLVNYSKEDCEKSGFCSKGWKLLGHGK